MSENEKVPSYSVDKNNREKALQRLAEIKAKMAKRRYKLEQIGDKTWREREIKEGE